MLSPARSAFSRRAVFAQLESGKGLQMSFTRRQIRFIAVLGLVLLILFAEIASAAIAIDRTVSKDQGTASTTVATAPFSTTSGNELLLAFVASDYQPSQSSANV